MYILTKYDGDLELVIVSDNTVVVNGLVNGKFTLDHPRFNNSKWNLIELTDKQHAIISREILKNYKTEDELCVILNEEET